MTVIINFFGTLFGSGYAIVTNLPIRWFYMGMVYYFLTCLQCSLQVTLTFQALIHFTDWVVGHAHLVMFGVFSLWLLGVMTYLIPRLLKTEWHSRKLCEWHFWLSAGGMLLMASDLILGGLFQGWSWAALQPWEASVAVSQPFWATRLIAGLAIAGGQVVFVYNIYKTWQRSTAATT
jgi:cytochrome c oxidase cbb3-type subunit 1